MYISTVLFLPECDTIHIMFTVFIVLYCIENKKPLLPYTVE